MATRIAWLLNFDSTDELANPASYVASRLPTARMREVMGLFFDLIAPDDLVLEDGANAVHVDAVQAFCPTPSALQRIAQLGLTPPQAPSLAVLQRVTDRAFCAGLGHDLPGAAFVRNLADLHAQLTRASWTHTHVIKRAFSFAGREQRRVHGGQLDDSTRGFCERSFARGEGVQVEPWVTRTLDVSMHGYLTRADVPLVGEPRAQRCDPMGRFLGMAAGPAELALDERKALERALTEAAAALAAAGYFGPFGVDAFRYVGPDGQVAFNPRCEINARFTMGYPRELLLRGLDAE